MSYVTYAILIDITFLIDFTVIDSNVFYYAIGPMP